jgi:hypothetical protein
MPEHVPMRDASSPRIARLRALFDRVAFIQHTQPGCDTEEGEFAVVLTEIEALATDIWSSPVQGWSDIVERALVAHHYHADGLGENGDNVFVEWEGTGPAELSVQKLVEAVLHRQSDACASAS